MSTARELIRELAAHDVSLSVDGADLVVFGPREFVTDDLVELMRAEKAALIEALRPCPGSLAKNFGEYRDAFRQVYDTYDCKRCGDPVLLDEGKFYVDWFNGRPHREVCRGRR